MKLFIILWSFVCFVHCLHSQNRNDTMQVLFIGNSYTHYHDLPQTVKEIAETQQINMEYTAIHPGGTRLAQHLQSEEVINTIKRGIWNYIVLQEQSTAPALPTEQVIKNVYSAASGLDSLIHEYNNNARVIFYMTWGHKNGSQKQVKNYPLINTYQGMQERLKISYLEMTYRHDAWCAPVGMAWQRVRQEHPDYILYEHDRSHPSALGSYLAANVIFTTLYQRSYQTSVINGLPPEQAEYIQQVAQKTVFENSELLNIKK